MLEVEFSTTENVQFLEMQGQEAGKGHYDTVEHITRGGGYAGIDIDWNYRLQGRAIKGPKP